MTPSSIDIVFGQLVDEVLRLSGRVATATDVFAASADLTGAQHMVLTAVVNAARPPTVPQIGRSLGNSRQAVQRIADRLERRGLIAYVDNPDHKVARLLTATVAGREAHAAIHQISLGWIADTTRGIDESALTNAVATLRAVRQRIEHLERSL